MPCLENKLFRIQTLDFDSFVDNMVSRRDFQALGVRRRPLVYKVGVPGLVAYAPG